MNHGNQPKTLWKVIGLAAVPLAVLLLVVFVSIKDPVDTGNVTSTLAAVFASQFGIGSSGSEVAQLQDLLISDGYLKVPSATGYFGALTKSALIEYQIANDIIGTGFVGPLTLSKLNGSGGNASLIAMLTAELNQLEAELAALISGNSVGSGGGGGGGGGGATNGTPPPTTPTTPPATSNIPMPPDTTDGIHLAQVEDSQIGGPIDPLDSISEEAQQIDLVAWGTQSQNTPSIYTTFYYPFQRDPAEGAKSQGTNGTHTLTWYKANHPDWIEYTCAANKYSNQADVPDSDVAWEFNSNADGLGTRVPIDIGNTDVLNYIFTSYLQPAILQNGYKGITFDNVALRNGAKECGHFTQNGTVWVQEFSGAEYDPAYINVVIAWAQWMYSHVHSIGGSVMMNYSYDFQLPAQYVPDLDVIAQNLDIDMPENGFTNIGNSSGNSSEAVWLTDIQFDQYIQNTLGKGILVLNYYPNTPTDTFNSTNVDAVIEWTLANYLLIKENHTYFTLVDTSTSYDQTNPRATLLWVKPEYSAPIGTPIKEMYKSEDVYVRYYTNGLAIVNPDPDKSYTFTLAAGRSYDYLNGKPAPASITMAAESGLVLIGH